MMPPDSAQHSPREPHNGRHERPLSPSIPISTIENCVDLTKDPESSNSTRKHSHDEDQTPLENARKRIKTSADNHETPTTCNACGKERRKYDKEIGRLQTSCTAKYIKIEKQKSLLQSYGEFHTEAKAFNDTVSKLLEKHEIVENYEEEYVLSLLQKLDDTKNELQNVRQDQESTKRELQDIQEERESAKRELQVIQEEHEFIRRELQILQKNHESNKIELEATKLQLVCETEGKTEIANTLAQNKQQLETTEKQLCEAVELNESLQLVNNQQGAKALKLTDDRKKEKKEFRSELAKLKKDLRAKETELKTETTERAALKNKNDELQENFDTKQAEWSEAKSQLLKKLQDSHGLSQKHNFKVADSVIIGDWHTLKHLIGQFVNKYTCQVANVMEREPTFSLTSCIAPETLQYLATSEFYPLMFEAYIWRWIKELVFRSNSTLWAGDLGVKFSAISVTVGNILADDDTEHLLPDYHAWRSNSNRFLSLITEGDFLPDNYRGYGVSMVKTISRLCGNIDEQGALDDILKIIHKARDVDIMFRKLRSSIDVGFDAQDSLYMLNTHGFPFSAEYMRNCHSVSKKMPENHTPTVDLVVSPYVFKCGNNDGTDYNQMTVLVKMDVLCDVKQIHSQQIPHSTEASLTGSDGKITAESYRQDHEQDSTVEEQSISSSKTIENEDMGQAVEVTASRPPQDPQPISVDPHHNNILIQSSRVLRRTARNTTYFGPGCQPGHGYDDSEEDELSQPSPKGNKRQSRDNEDGDYDPSNGQDEQDE